MVGDSRDTSAVSRLGYRHQKVQRLRKLFARRVQRDNEGVFVVEGVKLLREALEHSESVESVFVTAGTTHSVVARAHDLGIRVYELDEGVMERIADAVTPQPVCAVVAMRRHQIEDLATANTVVVLVDVRDPGNAGTILRSAEAAGVAGVVVCDGSVDPWNPKTVRSSAGSIFHVPMVTGITVVDALRRLGEFGFVRAGTAMMGQPYDRVDLSRKLALVFGNEANGLPAELETSLDEMLSIPIVGRSESLNVSMAASVLCFEVARQRRVVVESGIESGGESRNESGNADCSAKTGASGGSGVFG